MHRNENRPEVSSLEGIGSDAIFPSCRRIQAAQAGAYSTAMRDRIQSAQSGRWWPLTAPRNFGISRKPSLRYWLLLLGCDGDLNMGAFLELHIVTMFVS